MFDLIVVVSMISIISKDVMTCVYTWPGITSRAIPCVYITEGPRLAGIVLENLHVLNWPQNGRL